MKDIIVQEDRSFTKFLTSVDEELGRDTDSLNLFEWAVEDRYEEIIKNNIEFFKDRPDLLCISNEQILFELSNMLDYFVEKEEFEKCARIITIQNYINNAVKESMKDI